MTTQQQDLVFFEDNTLLSPSDIASNNLHVISHVEETKATWLVNTIIENSLVGLANLVNRELRLPAASHVTIVSFLNPKSFYVNSCRKYGLDLSKSPNFHFIDCLSGLFTKHITPNTAGIPRRLFDSIHSEIEQKKGLVLLEAPEILLQATDSTADDLLFQIHRIQRAADRLIVITKVDGPLIDLSSSIPTDPVYKTTDFLVKLLHKSSMNVSLSPLATGKAQDVTGCLTVARGARFQDLKTPVAEREYVYHIARDGSVKIFYR